MHFDENCQLERHLLINKAKFLVGSLLRGKTAWLCVVIAQRLHGGSFFLVIVPQLMWVFTFKHYIEINGLSEL